MRISKIRKRTTFLYMIIFREAQITKNKLQFIRFVGVLRTNLGRLHKSLFASGCIDKHTKTCKDNTAFLRSKNKGI